MQKKNRFLQTNVPSKYTATDPKTGLKATALTRAGAIFKLEGITGKKMNNPFIRKA